MTDRPASPSGRNHSLATLFARGSLSWNAIYAVAGNIFYNLCQLGIVVLLARFAGAVQLGQYNYASAISGPVVLFFSFQLRGALVADAGNLFSFGTYLRLRTLGILASGVVFTFVVGWQWFRQPEWPYILIFAGVCAGKMTNSAGEIAWATYQKRERLDLLAGSNCWTGLTSIIPFAIVLPLYGYWIRRGVIGAEYMPFGTAWAVWCYVLGWLLVYLGYDRPRMLRASNLDLSTDAHRVKMLAAQTFPLGLVMLLVTAADSIPRMIIAAQPDGEATLGHFGALANIPLAINLIMTQIALAAANRLATYFQEDIRPFLKLSIGLCLIAVAVGVGSFALAWFFGEPFLWIVYGKEYSQYAHEFQIVVLAQCILLFSNVFGIMTTHMRMFWSQVPAQALLIVATLIAGLVLIPRDPLTGGAWTLVIRSIFASGIYGLIALWGIVRQQRILMKPAHHTP